MAVKGAIRSNGTVRNDGFFGGVNRIGVTGGKLGRRKEESVVLATNDQNC